MLLAGGPTPSPSGHKEHGTRTLYQMQSCARAAGGAETGLRFPARCQVFGICATQGDSGFPENLIPEVLTSKMLAERIGRGASTTSKAVSGRNKLLQGFL